MGANASFPSSPSSDAAEPPLRWLPPGVSRGRFRELEGAQAITAMTGRMVDVTTAGEQREYAQMVQHVFGNLVKSGERFSLVLDCRYGLVAVWIRVQEPDTSEEQYVVTHVPRGRLDARQIYSRVLEGLRVLGLSMQILKNKLVAVIYESDDAFDEVAYLMKNHINPELQMIPFLSHLSVVALMKLLRRNLGPLRVPAIFTILAKERNLNTLSFKEKLEQLQSGELDEDWLLEFYDAMVKLLDYMIRFPGSLPAALAPILVDWGEMLVPLVNMRNALRTAYENSRDQSAWLEERPQLLGITQGMRPFRDHGLMKMRLDDPGIPTSVMNQVVMEIVELFDTRFRIANQGRTRDA